MPQASSRKRPAPGASPIVQNQQPQAPIGYNLSSSPMSNEQYSQWNQDNSLNGTAGYPDPTGSFSPTIYNSLVQAQATSPSQSNQLARRSVGQNLVTRAPYNNSGSETWSGSTDGSLQQPREEGWINDNDDLEQKAMVAKRDSQSKRKQIPPFVQKLSSFLDEKRNTDLIRWSNSGDSFVVLDEEEFAKTLIPELFKHNNYASFVRQLNMYGFHKKVGLSDNSMRASERKNKSPSEYYNPYFKRGRPNLLWLIQKPKNPPGKGKGGARVKQEDGIQDEDVEDVYDVEGPTPANQAPGDNISSLRNGRQPLMLSQGGGGLPQEELSAVQRELQAIRHQQQLISSVIQKIRRDHEQLYGQAAAFQELHNRHENSINAILTFLATVYNRSLEGQGAQNLANLFAGAIPQDTQSQGNVVHVGDYEGQDPNVPNSQIRRTFRRQPLLLKAPPSALQSGDQGRISNASTPAASAASPQPPTPNPNAQANSDHYFQPSRVNGQTGAAQDLLDRTVQDLIDRTHSNRSSHSPQFPPSSNANGQIPERDIMSLINSANANETNLSNSRMDFPEALSHLQNADGKSPLTQHQRNNVLQLMATGSANTSQTGNNNALISPNPPNVAVPSIPQWDATKEELDFLERTLKEQDSKVANLSSMLQPLSPSGSIPGLMDSQGNGGHPPADPLEFDQIFNSDNYFNDAGNGGDIDFGDGNGDLNGSTLFDFDNPTGDNLPNGFGLDGVDEQGGRIVETVNSSEATSPANTVNTGEDSNGGQEEGRSPRKRRRGH